METCQDKSILSGEKKILLTINLIVETNVQISELRDLESIGSLCLLD